MSIFESLTLMISFGMLIAYLSNRDKKNNYPTPTKVRVMH